MSIVHFNGPWDFDFAPVDNLHIGTWAEVGVVGVTDHLVVTDGGTVGALAHNDTGVVSDKRDERRRATRGCRVLQVTHVVGHDLRQVIHGQQLVQLGNRVDRGQTRNTPTKQVRAIRVRQNRVRRDLINKAHGCAVKSNRVTTGQNLN